MSHSWWYQPIVEPDRKMREVALQRQAQLTKPPGSLGRLEALAVTLAAMQSRPDPRLKKPWISVFAADHGVAAAGVSAFPQAVTMEMVRNFSRGGAAISVLARLHGAVLEVVNVGTAGQLEPLSQVVDARVAAGTRNFVADSAMDLHHLEEAMEVGRSAVERAVRQGCDLFIGGEMGIGNTTAAAAVAAALLNIGGDEMAGAGTGLDAAGINRKAEVIQQALDFHRPYLDDPVEVVRRLGGFEIAALSGSMIAAAQQGIPLLIDGFITTVAALVAVRIQPDVGSWMLFSHRSAEQGHQRVLATLDAEPLLDLQLRLGERSGAALALPLLQQACQLHNEMATFAEAGVSES